MSGNILHFSECISGKLKWYTYVRVDEEGEILSNPFFPVWHLVLGKDTQALLSGLLVLGPGYAHA